MYIALSLVGLTFLAAQCRSRAASENDRPYSVETVFYQPIEHRSTKQERPLHQVSRALGQYEYEYEKDRQLNTQFEPNYFGRHEYQPRSRAKQGKQLPTIEQYLKEVTPTTKTAYDPSNYDNAGGKKLVQYTYQPQYEQQSLYQQHIEEAPKGAPIAQNILAYQNARIAHQNAIYEQQRAEQLQKQQNAALYVTENIQKSLPRQKVTKPKPSTLDDEIAYYTKLQHEQQQLKQQNEAFEVKQAAPSKYQTRIPQNSKPELLAAEEESGFLYQPEAQSGQYNTPSQIFKPARQSKEPVYLSGIKYQQKATYQPVPENDEVKYYHQPQQIQYQLQPVGSRYILDQNQARYQEPSAKQVQQSESPVDAALQKYRLNIIKYNTVQPNKPVKPAQQAQSQYIPEEPGHDTQRNHSNNKMRDHIEETSLSLRDILPLRPKHYDKNRAPKFHGQPTIVYFHVTVLSLDSINEESMTYVTDIFLAQSWRDPRLRLPENMSEEYRILDVEWLHSIWRPDCFFKNAKSVTFHEMTIPNHYLWLYHDKTLLYMSKLTLVLSCAMKFESYPHDTQICTMMIESLSHTDNDLVFIWNMTDPLVVNPEIELPQLDISNNYTTDCTIEYSTGNFTCLAVVFNLRRRLGYHLFHTYIPSALIVVMSWISFWIKPEAIPARVTLGVTSLLTLATQNTQSQQSLPPVSYVKAIDVWMSSCSVFVFMSLMEFAVVNNYMGPVATKAMKGYSDEDLPSDVNDYRGIERPRFSTISQPQYPTFCNGRSIALCIDQFSRFFFPFSFLILNIAYWSTFL